MPEELKAIAEALGLGEEATVEDIVAAIKALAEKAAAPMEGGEMAKELQKAVDRIAELEKAMAGQTTLSKWKDKAAKMTAIPGTPTEIAEKLADIEAKAGEEAANAQFAALEAANNLAVEAQKVVGTSRTGTPTDFDNEVANYQKENPKALKVEAIKAVSKARPDLYLARRS